MSWLTADLPGIGGRYKFCPEDFYVEELPLYPCSGQGEHLYLFIEKRDQTTNEVLRQIARSLRLSEREIGYAGLKDARAVTRQWLSLPARVEGQLKLLSQLPFDILQTERHSNKLRLGHLAGNRFVLRVRQPVEDAAARAEKILAQLSRLGVPNHFGEQRYGVLGNSHNLGRLLLQRRYQEFCCELIGDPSQINNRDWKQAAERFQRGDLAGAAKSLPTRMPEEKRLLERLANGLSPQKAVFGLPRRLLRLYLSAHQSSLFDQLLSMRLPYLHQLLQGDMAIKHVNGASFRVSDPIAEQPRADAFEISPSAPLFGVKVPLAEGLPGQAERALLSDQGLKPEDWKLGDGLTMTGERRPLRVPLSGVELKPIASDLQVSFCLPRGSYATSVLSELIK